LLIKASLICFLNSSNFGAVSLFIFPQASESALNCSSGNNNSINGAILVAGSSAIDLLNDSA